MFHRYSPLLALLGLLLIVGLATPRAGAGRAATPAVAPIDLQVELLPVSIIANDIVYDPVRDRLYASLSGDQGALGNSIVTISPQGLVNELTFIGSEPNVLALSAGAEYLYVGLDGAGAARRLNLTTLAADPQWPLQPDPPDFHVVVDMVVIDAAQNVVAIAEGRDHYTPWMNVVIYADGVARPHRTPEGTQHDRLEGSDDPGVLYSLNTQTSGQELYKLAVDSDGVTIVQEVAAQFGGVAPFDLRYAAGRLYGSDGRLVDAATLAPLGRFAAEGPVAPLPETGRVFFVTYDGAYMRTHLQLFDVATFRLLAAADVPNFSGTWPQTPVELLPAGPSRLAMRTADGRVYWLNYQLRDEVSFLPFLSRGPWAGRDGQ